MGLDLANANAVIVAHHFNPTITDQIWLSENGIVDRGEPSGSYVFSDMLVQVETREFHLLIVPDRCQMVPGKDVDDAQKLVTERLGRLIEKLPHTPYRAVGVNFTWMFKPDTRPFEEFIREKFFVRGCPLHEKFSDGNPRFGSYLSKDHRNCRLKLDIKPIRLEAKEGPVELMQFSFNFNLDLNKGEKDLAPIMAVLKNWNTFRLDSEEIVKTSVEGF